MSSTTPRSPRSPRALRRGLASALLATALAGTAVLPAAAAEPPPGGRWYETWITTDDGETLHVDVIRGEDVPDDVRQPVILIASPYLGLGSPTEAPGPSDRFFDLIVGADLLADYTVVQVSLRGTGGSSGCLDILGPGEQEDVRAAVEFAATADFSTGGVGMYGKSYDANTGGLALATRPEGLDAVVAQQIAVDRYRGSYNDRIRLLQSLVYPSVTYGTQAEAGFSLASDPRAIANSLGRSADCQVFLAEHYVDDESRDFWRVRDFVDRAEGSDIPAIITTGYLDNPTNVGAGAVDLFNQLTGPKHLWIGWWDHVRGNDTVGDELAMGREDWFGHVRRFFDHHVRGLPLAEAPTHLDPVVAAQDSDGFWREEDAFPAADTVMLEAPVLPGSYVDDARNRGTSSGSGLGSGGVGRQGSGEGRGTWTFSEPLEARVHLAGIPTATIDVTPSVPRSNLVVNVYDVDEGGDATMITRGGALVDAAGEKEVLLYPTDWVFEPGHRIGILVSGSNNEHYAHVETNTTVTVEGGTIGLPLLPADRAARPLPGEPAPRLLAYRAAAPFPVPVDPASRTADGFVVEAPTSGAPAPAEPAPAEPAPTPAPAPLPATGGGLSVAALALLAAAGRPRQR